MKWLGKGYKLFFVVFFAFCVFPLEFLYGATFIDDSGRQITFNKPFRRIISLYPAHTENLFSLGLDKEIIGVSRHEAYPPEALTKSSFSFHDDAERFIAAKPDLILIRPMVYRGYRQLFRKLMSVGITVVSLQPTTVRAMFKYWKKLGMLTGREKQADSMVKRFKERLAEIKAIVAKIPLNKRKRVYFESIHKSMKTFAPSSISMFALESAGGINVASDAVSLRGSNIATYGKEHILSKANIIDVYLAERGAMNKIKVSYIENEAGFDAIKAVREGKIYIVDEKIVSRPTLRLLEGIYEIGRILYPEVFNDVSELVKKPLLSRADYAKLIIKMLNIPLRTPDYRHDVKDRDSSKHRYGSYVDVNYMGEDYKFIETAVFRGLFRNADGCKFYPERPITRADIAYSIFVEFDLPEPGLEGVEIKDITSEDPVYNHVRRVVALKIMKLADGNMFNPDAPVSGREAFEIITKAQGLCMRGE